MIVEYRDVFSGDTLFSNAFPMKPLDEMMCEVEGKFVTVHESQYDDPRDDVVCEGSTRQVIDVVQAYQLKEVSLTRNGYVNHLKAYIKRIRSRLERTMPTRVEAFQATSHETAKRILASFDDYQFYTGKSGMTEAMLVIMGYREDGLTPFFLFWRDGLREIREE